MMDVYIDPAGSNRRHSLRLFGTGNEHIQLIGTARRFRGQGLLFPRRSFTPLNRRPGSTYRIPDAELLRLASVTVKPPRDPIPSDQALQVPI
jgi:hypothetical protein